MAEQPRPLYAELRKREICSILQTHGQVSVEELCARFLMSPATIRNDLSELARSGLLQRTHGGAIRCAHPAAPEFPEQGPHGSADPMLRIARRALSFIQPGDVIALDAGAATYALSCRIRKEAAAWHSAASAFCFIFCPCSLPSTGSFPRAGKTPFCWPEVCSSMPGAICAAYRCWPSPFS